MSNILVTVVMGVYNQHNREELEEAGIQVSTAAEALNLLTTNSEQAAKVLGAFTVAQKKAEVNAQIQSEEQTRWELRDAAKVISAGNLRKLQKKGIIDLSKSDEEVRADLAAAVADFRVKTFNTQKIKKTNENSMTLELVKNPDILKGICAKKTTADNAPVIVGFCAETENLIEYAKKKIAEKGCDFLVANDVSRKDIGFSSDENEVFIIDKNLNVLKLEKQKKSLIAKEIIGEVYEKSGNLYVNQ